MNDITIGIIGTGMMGQEHIQNFNLARRRASYGAGRYGRGHADQSRRDDGRHADTDR